MAGTCTYSSHLSSCMGGETHLWLKWEIDQFKILIICLSVYWFDLIFLLASLDTATTISRVVGCMEMVICVAVDGIKWMMVVGVGGLGLEKKKVEGAFSIMARLLRL